MHGDGQVELKSFHNYSAHKPASVVIKISLDKMDFAIKFLRKYFYDDNY